MSQLNPQPLSNERFCELVNITHGNASLTIDVRVKSVP